MMQVPIQPCVVGWPPLYQPAMGQPVIGQYLRRHATDYHWFLSQRYWYFSFQEWVVQLKQVKSYAVGDPGDFFHYYFPGTEHFPPSWDSTAVIHNGISKPGLVHDGNQLLSWRLSFIRYADQKFHPGPSLGDINNTLVLYLCGANGEAFDQRLWYVSRSQYTPRLYPTRSPIIFTAIDDTIPDITLYPLGP